MRFYCLREISFGQDGDWGREKFINRNNADLANNFGNLAQRSLSMIAKNFGGQMPPRRPVGRGQQDRRRNDRGDRDAWKTPWHRAVARGSGRTGRGAERGQPLFRRPGALGQEGRPGAHGRDPRDDRRRRAARGDRCAALRADRRPSCSTCWRCRPTSGCCRMRSIPMDRCRRAPRCRRRSRCSGSSSTPRQADNADRQPLPSRFRRAGRRPGRRPGARRGQRRRRHGDDLDARRALRRDQRDCRADTRGLVLGRHPPAPRP